MGWRNNGQGEVNALQNRFTAYLLIALERKKNEFINKQTALDVHECLTSSLEDQAETDPGEDVLDTFPVLMTLEDLALMRALEHLTARERYILFERVLAERSYEELADLLGLKYNGIAAAYRRVIIKLRKELRGDGV